MMAVNSAVKALYTPNLHEHELHEHMNTVVQDTLYIYRGKQKVYKR